MLPTPSTSHLSFNRIYEPAEDSYLLLDTLSSPSEVNFLTGRFGANSASEAGAKVVPSPVVLEVGTGSGVVLAFIAAHAQAIFGRSDVLALGTDINRYACQATDETVVKAMQTVSATSETDNGDPALFLDSLHADLAAPLRRGMVDVLIFNPPYVPTPELPRSPDSESIRSKARGSGNDFEEESYLLSLSYAGGINGMETTNKLLEQIPHVLSGQMGVAYILLCAQNKPEEVKQCIHRAWGPSWFVETVGKSGKMGGWEKLQVIRLSRR
ncbi:S-adenosylmethionine-dependent methyltransferase [Hypocenomyce scalaris]|nr:S-adenosylmethionine-dependent methyltransferase [Hypocenomyce scalaris]